jgi:hypothetical protein
VSGTKVVINETCGTREQERLIRYMQDSLGWEEGDQFEVRRPPLSPDLGDELHNCADCGSPFTFTAGEREFFSKNGLQPPKRCKPCRDKRKAAKRNVPSGRGRSPARSR